jgi:hypothetical protein
MEITKITEGKLGVTMIRRLSTLTVNLLLVLGFQIINAQLVSGQEPVLEEYTIGQGGTLTLNLDGFDSTLSDRSFGGVAGTAATRSIIHFSTESDHSNLSLQVFRRIPPGTIVFALIVNRVEVRAIDLKGEEVYSRDLEGFVFGDSASGNWCKALIDLPANISQIKVKFFGNFE